MNSKISLLKIVNFSLQSLKEWRSNGSSLLCKCVYTVGKIMPPEM